MKTIKKLLTILLIAFATVAGAQNNWYAPSVFHENVNFKKVISHTNTLTGDTDFVFFPGTSPLLRVGKFESCGTTGLFTGTIKSSVYEGSLFEIKNAIADSCNGKVSLSYPFGAQTIFAFPNNPSFGDEGQFLHNTGTGFTRWDAIGNYAWGLTGNAGTNPATNFLGTTDGQPLIIKSDSAVAANIGDSVFFAMGKKIPYQLAPATYSGFKLVSSDHLGHWAGIYGLNSPTPGNPFNGFTVVGVMDSINEFYSISEYAPGVMEHEIITPGGVNVVSKLTQTTYNLGDYFSSNQYLQFDWEVGTWNLGANQWNNATIYGDTVANTITNICDGGFVVKNHSNTDLALCDSVNITLTDAVHISTNLPRIKFDDVVRLNAYTVGTLPAGTVGDMAYVTDAAAPVYGATLVGGGAVRTIAFFDGTNWTAH